MSSQHSVIFYSPSNLSNLNLDLILKMLIEHSPGWIIDGSRKVWILYAIETKDLAFLRILTRAVDPFIKTSEYLEFAVGIENNIQVIEYLSSLNFPIDQLKVLKSAVEKKAFENLKFLHEKKRFPIDDNYKLFSSAAGIEDNISILEYLKLHNCPISHLTTSKSVAKKGALNNLKWLWENGLFMMEDPSIFTSAIGNGSLDVLKLLSDHGCLIENGLDPYTQFEKCSIETLEWLIEKGIEIDPERVFRGAAKHGCLVKMKWMFKKNQNSIEHSYIFKAAAKHGSLENLEWLLKNGCRIDDWGILAAAARKGHFDIMKWLLTNNCPIQNSEILVAAADFGSIEQMKWLFDNNCPIGNNSRIFMKAAEKGNVEVMELLFEKACPTDRAMRGAARHGCLTIMKWLKRKGCLIDDFTIMISAAEYGSLRNMKWLLDNGCPIDNWEIFGKAARHGSLDIMNWLLDNGCSINNTAIMIAASGYGSLVSMKWLLENGCPIDDHNIFYYALYHGSLRNIKWLLEKKGPKEGPGRTFATRIFGSFKTLKQLLENLRDT